MFAITVILLLLQPTNSQVAKPPRFKPAVCVVGGGITGLAIAYKLQKNRQAVILFEKNADHIGGKLDTERVWDIIWEKGPVIFSSGEPFINHYVKDLGLNRSTWNGQNVGFFNPITTKRSYLTDAEIAAMKAQATPLIIKYAAIRRSYPPWLFEARGFEHVHILQGHHDDLFLSTADWLKTHGLSGLGPTFEIIFTCEGYGHLADLPALYMLKLLSLDVLRSLGNLILGGSMAHNRDIFTIYEGWRELAFRLYRRLDNVFMDYELVNIDRSDYNSTGRVNMLFRTAKGSTQRYIEWCKSVVLAFPPLLPKVSKIIDDITREERILLSKIKVNKYFSSGQILKGTDNDKFVYLAEHNSDLSVGDGRPIALVKSGKGRMDAYTIYSWIYGQYPNGPNAKDIAFVDDLLTTFLTKFNGQPPLLSFVEGYEYFPHVQGSDMKAGFFASFSDLQGKQGVYWATTATSFESVNTAIENAEAVADRIMLGGDTVVPFVFPDWSKK